MSRMDEIEETARRVLRHAMGSAVDRNLAARSPEELDEILAPLQHVEDGCMEMLREVLRQAELHGIGSVHRAMHRTVVDHEMLDEAVEYASAGEGEADGQ